jgi:hypothetical protein
MSTEQDIELLIGGRWFAAYFIDTFPRVVLHLRGTTIYLHHRDPRIEDWRKV